jgi:hypothetical protein
MENGLGLDLCDLHAPAKQDASQNDSLNPTALLLLGAGAKRRSLGGLA